MKDDLFEFFKGLANENRLTMVFTVFADKAEHSVGDVARQIGVGHSTASEHLTILRRCGVLRSRKQNREVFYSIDKDRVTAVFAYLNQWLDCC